MNVFELATQYRQLEALAQQDHQEGGDFAPTDDYILAQWLAVEGDLNTKMENIGFAIRNREAVYEGKLKAIAALEDSAESIEKEIKRLKKLGVDILIATKQQKAGGDFLKLSVVPNPPAVEIQNEAAIPPEYLRVVEPVPAWYAADKKQIADDLKLGVIVPGARLVPSVRLAIK